MVAQPYFPLLEQVTCLLPDHGWTVRADAAWCYVVPDHQSLPYQGWKLHVSATPLSALLVLARVSRVLVEQNCAFKFAASVDRLNDLTSPKADRGSAGKFITIYPGTDTDAIGLAEALHRVTAGMPGPQILSDRRYRPDSLVHLRYGAIAAPPVLAEDGLLHHRLRHPNGSSVVDRREAWFVLPDWVDDLLPPPAAPAGDSDLRLAGRYRVTGAIQHANKGGVYRAFDDRDDRDVIIKQARAHVGAMLSGRDSQSLLRAERRALRALGPLGLSPCYVDMFTVQDSLFLVQEALPGTTLAEWMSDRLRPGQPLADALPTAEVMTLASRVIGLVAAIHAAGFWAGDMTPSNLVVDAEGRIRCIDLETAGSDGTPIAPIGTPGYFPPEYVTGVTSSGSAYAADRYALGAVLFYLTTGVDPVLLEADPPDGRRSRLDHWLSLIQVDSLPLRILSPIIRGLMNDDPTKRMTLAEVTACIDRPALPDVSPPAATATPNPGLAVPSPAELLADLIGYLADSTVPGPTGPFESDPRAVNAGAAGVLGVLTRAAPRHDATAILMTTLRQAPPAGPVLPGLHSGVAGIAWAGYDAARARGEDPDWALDLARTVPVDWHVPDVYHGTAGAGLAFLHLWQAGAGEEFRARAVGYADVLSRTMIDTPHGPLWQIPVDADTALAGQTQYGFAHGAAGIATFLLAAYAAVGEERYLDSAIRAGTTIARNAQHTGTATWWYIDPVEQRRGGYPAMAPHWCSGASGIGTFLLRLWTATGDSTWATLAIGAAHTARAEAWRTSTCYCHGAAGNGDFLLDAAVALDDGVYHDWATEHASVICAHSARRQGRWSTADDSHLTVTPHFATGTAGTAAFLHRLLHGGPRWWLTDIDALRPASALVPVPALPGW